MEKNIAPLHENNEILQPPQDADVQELSSIKEPEVQSPTDPGVDYPTPPAVQVSPKIDTGKIYPTPLKQAENRPTSSVSLVSPETESESSVSGLLKSLLIILGILVIIAPYISSYANYIISAMLHGYPIRLGSMDPWSSISLYWKTAWISSSSAVVALMYLFIGGGIILRKETARVALIAMSVIAIIVSIYGLFTYMQVAKEYDDLLATQQSRTSTLDDTKSGASAAQASDSAVSQKATNQLLSLGANSTSSSYMSYYIAITVFSFVINSIIIVFLTRPTVRRSFR